MLSFGIPRRTGNAAGSGGRRRSILRLRAAGACKGRELFGLVVGRPFPVLEFRHGHVEGFLGLAGAVQLDNDGPELVVGEGRFHAVDPSGADDQVALLAWDAVVEGEVPWVGFVVLLQKDAGVEAAGTLGDGVPGGQQGEQVGGVLDIGDMAAAAGADLGTGGYGGLADFAGMGGWGFHEKRLLWRLL